MKRVVFVLQEPTPYRTPHLESVAARPDLDVTVVYAARSVQQRMWDVPAPSARVIYLEGTSIPATRLLQHDYAVTPGVYPLLSRLAPDVVVIGGWSLMATQLAILWARVNRVPYLLMSDNHLAEPRPAWVKAVKRLVLRAVVPQAAACLVPGRLGREHVLHYGARVDRVLVFPLTIDVPAFASEIDSRRPRRDAVRQHLGVRADSVMVLHVGRLIRQKGVDVLIRAVAEAQRQGRRLQLVVAGSGPEEMSLRALATSLDAPVSFVGFLDQSALKDTYAAADIFALLSRRETWGVVVNEAAASGLPLVLSTAVGAAADLLEPAGNGVAVPPDAVSAASKAIGSLVDDAGLRSRYGRRSREIASAWGYQASVEELARLVSDVTA